MLTVFCSTFKCCSHIQDVACPFETSLLSHRCVVTSWLPKKGDAQLLSEAGRSLQPPGHAELSWFDLPLCCLPFLACWLSVSTQGSKDDARALRCTDTKSVCMWAPVGLLHKVQAYCKMHCWFSIRTLLQYCTHVTALTTCGIQMYCTLCLALCLLPAKKKQQKKGPKLLLPTLCVMQYSMVVLCYVWHGKTPGTGGLLCFALTCRWLTDLQSRRRGHLAPHEQSCRWTNLRCKTCKLS